MASKKYQFTLTDKYVSSWGYIEAVRELLQNAYDYGNYVVSFDDEQMSIKNYNDKLDIKTLLMGYGTKVDDIDSIGGFGEGFILALLVLTRLGFKVTIKNANEIWEPYFDHSEEFQERLLYIGVKANPSPNNDFEIIIDGLGTTHISTLKSHFLGLGDSYSAISTQYGEILTDANQKGRMYVEGLPINKDAHFDYGYNFKAEYVKLDRDRKDINTYELQQITSLAVIYMENRDFNMVDNLIECGKSDAHYLKEGYVHMPDDFVEEYSVHLKDRFEVDEETVVINESNKEVIKELQRMDVKTVIVPNKTYADVINRTSTYSSDMINEAHNRAQHKTEIDEAYDEYECSEYKMVREWAEKYNLKDKVAQITLSDHDSTMWDDFVELLENMEPRYFEKIRSDFDKLC